MVVYSYMCKGHVEYTMCHLNQCLVNEWNAGQISIDEDESLGHGEDSKFCK